VDYLRHANKIIVLDNQTISQQGTYQDALDQGWASVTKDIASDYSPPESTNFDITDAADDIIEETTQLDLAQKTSQLKKRAADIAEREKLDDMKRSAGDTKLYWYYYGFIGHRNMAMFILGIVMNTFGLSFRGTFFHFSWQWDLLMCVYVVKLTVIDIWLKWWSDIGGREIARYVSVFVVLSVLATAGSFIYLWSVIHLVV
jgi:hypothetical protein